MSDPNQPDPSEVTSLNADELDLDELEEVSGGQCEVYLPPGCGTYDTVCGTYSMDREERA